MALSIIVLPSNCFAFVSLTLQYFFVWTNMTDRKVLNYIRCNLQPDESQIVSISLPLRKINHHGRASCCCEDLHCDGAVPYAPARGSAWELLNTLRELSKSSTTTHTTGVGGPAVSVLCRTSSLTDVHNDVPCLDTQNLATLTPAAYQWRQGWVRKHGSRRAVR